MDIKDAFIVTGLGVGVVFFGLILTNLMIFSFSLVPKIFDRFKQIKNKAQKEPEVDTKSIRIEPPAPPVEPDILAVITTVIEVEWRLRTALME